MQVEISVTGQSEDDVYDEDDETGEVEPTTDVQFSVFVNKGGDENLVFQCSSDGSYLEVQDVSLEPVSGDLQGSLYTGPVRGWLLFG